MDNIRRKINIKLQHWLAPLGTDLPEIYLVGGAVRDLLLGQFPKDLDLASFDAQKIAAKLATVHKAGKVDFEHKGKNPCFRVINRNNPQNFLDIVPLQGKNILEDLQNRDFKINAMAYRLQQEGLRELVDPFGGCQDIKKRIIQEVNSKSLLADPLRMIRAFRFAAKLGFSIEEYTLKNIEKNYSLIQNVSVERISAELQLILSASGSYKIIIQMLECGLFPFIFPEIKTMQGCTQNKYHHLDVWQHCLLAFENIEKILNNFETDINWDQSDLKWLQKHGWQLKLAALFHDIGKPESRTIKDNGQITFYRHDKVGAIQVERLAQRLKLSKSNQVLLKDLVEQHLYIRNLTERNVKKSTILRFLRTYKQKTVGLLVLSLADVRSQAGPLALQSAAKQEYKASIKKIYNFYVQFKNKNEKKPLLTGRDLLEMGLKPGPQLGNILQQIQQEQDDGQINSRQQALQRAKKILFAL